MEMEGNKPMAEKMDNKKKPAAPTLPVSVEKKQTIKQQQARAAPRFLHIGINLLWTFFNAVIVVTIAISSGFAVVVAYTFITHYGSRASSSWLLLPRAAVTETTDAEDFLASALSTGMLWGSIAQVVAVGALGLLLLIQWRRRWRVRQADAALALTVVGHCMYACVVIVFRPPDPAGAGGLCLFFMFLGNAAIFICAVGDLLRILAVLRGRED